MIIPEKDAVWAVTDEFIQYFSRMQNIEDYLRYVKKEVIKTTSTLFPLHGEFFNEDIHPNDMEFDIKFVGDRFQHSVPQDHYNTLLRAVSSHNNESNIPGRELRWMVYEKNTRNFLDLFDSDLLQSTQNLEIFGWEKHRIFLSLIVMRRWDLLLFPLNHLDITILRGKLLALLCCSHFARETLNKVFEKDIALFETTSLYGSTTDASQYDVVL